MNLLKTIVNQYLTSSEFNGVPIYSIADFDIREAELLVKRGLIEVIHSDFNPYIKFFNAQRPINEQLTNLEHQESCLYPTPWSLAGIPTEQRKKYRALLQSGWGQYEIVYFNVAVLELYFGNPQYYITDMGYRGQIDVRDEYVENEELELIKDYGIAYGPDKEKDKAIGVFVRDLAYLSEKAQMRWASHEEENQAQWRINGGFFKNLILGEWIDTVWAFDALLEEQVIINKICDSIGIHQIFTKTWSVSECERPDDYRLILIPTRKNYYDFVNVLEKIVVNNISSKSFTGQQANTRAVIPDENEGTISLLGKWLKANGRNEQAVDNSIIAPLKHIRKIRQTPAHKIVDNAYDNAVYKDQNRMVEKAYEAMSCLRIMLSTHPLAKKVIIPEYLLLQKGIVFY